MMLLDTHTRIMMDSRLRGNDTQFNGSDSGIPQVSSAQVLHHLLNYV
jgi:hypothetical protein